jgi:hypothetical protein
MLYVILLLILAVLLFGSSVVIGAFGRVLGFIAFSVALATAAMTFDIDPANLVIGILVIIAVVAGAAQLAAFLHDRRRK